MAVCKTCPSRTSYSYVSSVDTHMRMYTHHASWTSNVQDMMRFLPTRLLQTSFNGTHYTPTVGDDLDSFTYLLLHNLILRDVQQKTGRMELVRAHYDNLGATHPKTLMDNRDDVESMLYQISKDVARMRANGKEPRGTSVDSYAEQLCNLFVVNISSQSGERELANQGKTKEGIEERARKQHELYLKQMERLCTAVNDGWAREEEKSRKIEETAEQRALEEAQETEDDRQSGSEDAAETEEYETGDEEGSPDGAAPQDAMDVEGLEVAETATGDGDICHERPSKRPRLD